MIPNAYNLAASAQFDFTQHPFKPTHISTWFKPSWISARILKEPTWRQGHLERGAMILNQVDPLVEKWPDLRKLFILIERHGWYGPNESGFADIALVEDLSAWTDLSKRDPGIIHLPIGPADFVDENAFYPLPNVPDFDAIQISCWSRRKRIELFIEAAAKLPHLSFLHLGHFEDSGSADELRYRDECVALAKKLNANIWFPYIEANSNEEIPLLKSKINGWINRARIGILTAIPEGINRFKMECLAANRPMLVAADAGVPTTKHINAHTGRLFPPTADALASAIETSLMQYNHFQPRRYVLEHTGKTLSLAKLKEALHESSTRTGGWFHFDDVDWDGRNESLFWGQQAVIEIERTLVRSHGKETDTKIW